MACPYFLPRTRTDASPWDRPPRMPLGAIYLGTCEAGGIYQAGGAGNEPPEDEQREWCNRGYARGECSCFPQASETDAVRFSVREERGGDVTLIYILERDYAPRSHGTIEYRDGRIFGVEGILEAQARAFVESWQRQKERETVAKAERASGG